MMYRSEKILRKEENFLVTLLGSSLWGYFYTPILCLVHTVLQSIPKLPKKFITEHNIIQKLFSKIQTDFILNEAIKVRLKEKLTEKHLAVTVSPQTDHIANVSRTLLQSMHSNNAALLHMYMCSKIR